MTTFVGLFPPITVCDLADFTLESSISVSGGFPLFFSRGYPYRKFGLMGDLVEDSNRKEGQQHKKTYHFTRLVRFGTVSTLTAGGSGSPTEGSGAKNPRP